MYWLTKYDGDGSVADEFQLSAEYWDSPDDGYDEDSTFIYRGEEISMGEYEITYDWSYDLLENSGETFNQLMAGNNQGVVSKLELRQFLFPNEDIEVAKKQIEEIKKEEPKTDELLGE